MMTPRPEKARPTLAAVVVVLGLLALIFAGMRSFPGLGFYWVLTILALSLSLLRLYTNPRCYWMVLTLVVTLLLAGVLVGLFTEAPNGHGGRPLKLGRRNSGQASAGSNKPQPVAIQDSPRTRP